MHLFALLIATALSSQFGALSNTLEFTVSPGTVHSDTTSTVAIKRTGGAGAWTTPKVTFTLDDDIAGDETWTALTGTDPNWSIAGVDFADIIGVEEGVVKIYVWVSPTGTQTKEAALDDPAEIAVDDDYWWVELDAVDEDTKSLKNVKVHAPKEGWDETPAKVTLCITDDPAAAAGDEFDITGESTTLADGVYSFGAVDIKSLTLDTTKPLFAFVKLSGAATNVEGWADGKFEIPVAEAVLRFTFTMTPGSITPATDALTTIAIVQDGGETWDPTKKLLVTFSIDEDHSAQVLVEEDDGWKIASFDMKKLGRRFAADELTISVAYDVVGTIGAITASVPLKVPKVFTITGAVHPVAFRVMEPAGTLTLPEMDPFHVTVKEGASGEEDTWIGTIKLFLTLDKREIPAIANPAWRATGKNTGVYKTTTAVAASEIEGIDEATKLYVWVMNTPPARFANANENILSAPVEVTVHNVVPTTFDVVPSFVPWATPLTTAKAKITPSDSTTLSNTHFVNLTYSAPKSNEDPDPIKITLIKEGEEFFIPATALTPFGILEANLPATITGTVFASDDTQVGEEFTLTVDHIAFTVSPGTIDLAEEALPTITVTQRTGSDQWDTKVFLYFAKAPSDTPTTITVFAEAEYALVSETHTWKVENFDATDITGIKKEDKIYVYAATDATDEDDGTLVENCVGVIDVIETAAEESTFELEKTSLPWAADLKTPKIEITPKPTGEHNWPVGEGEVKVKFAVPAAPKSNTDPEPKIITVVVEGDEGEEKWYIPADEDLSAFVPEEAPEADILLEVTASIDGGDSYLDYKVTFTIKKPEPEEPEEPEAAMGVSPLLSLLAALVFLFVKLF